jgi:hypothetical protein
VLLVAQTKCKISSVGWPSEIVYVQVGNEGGIAYTRTSRDKNTLDDDTVLAIVCQTSVKQIYEHEISSGKPACLSTECRIVCACHEVGSESPESGTKSAAGERRSKDEL